MDIKYTDTEWDVRGKDSPTERTVTRIKDILSANGFHCSYEPLEPRMESCFCAMLKTEGFNCNGKGISPSLCEASAYGETMERFQNKKLNLSLKYFDAYFKQTEAAFPARPLTGPLPECVQSLRTKIIDSLGSGIALHERQNLVDDLISQLTFSGNHVFRTCYSVKNRCSQDLPVHFLQVFTGTNGMAAGNTYEEAVVQGLSEIFERYSVIQIITKKLTPPQIPAAVIETYPSILRMIKKIEADPNYKVLLLDASLGVGLPCVMCVILNRAAQTFGVKVGAHPNMLVAMERCFTEAMQGWTLEQFSKASKISFHMDGREAWSEIRNILKISKGNFPPSLFGETPSWTYTSWPNAEGTDNRALLTQMVSVVDRLAGDMYIQDVGFLGFPAVYIYVAGISEVVPTDYLWLKESQLLVAADRIFCHLDSITEQETQDLLSLARLRRTYLMCNTVSAISNCAYQHELPGAGDEMGLLAAACCYKLGNDKEALRLLKTAPKTPYFNALSLFLNALVSGIDRAAAEHLVRSVAESTAAERVLSDFRDRKNVLCRLYPQCSYHCEQCAIPCQQNEIRNTYMKLLASDRSCAPGTENLQSLF